MAACTGLSVVDGGTKKIFLLPVAYATQECIGMDRANYSGNRKSCNKRSRCCHWNRAQPFVVVGGAWVIVSGVGGFVSFSVVSLLFSGYYLYAEIVRDSQF